MYINSFQKRFLIVLAMDNTHWNCSSEIHHLQQKATHNRSIFSARLKQSLLGKE